MAEAGERPRRCVAYVRVSTKEQSEDSQRAAIEEFCRSRGMEVLQWFIDKGVSRSVPWSRREGSSRMVQFLESGGRDLVSYVVVFDFTRLGYDLRDILSLFDKVERELGLRILSVKDTWLNTEDPHIRDLLIRIFSWLSEMELRLRQERVEAARKAGRRPGRPPKVTDEEILAYLRRYPRLSLRAIWKIMRADGREISYDRLTKRVKALEAKGVVTKGWQAR